jgi:peptidoglycan/LPS O-acetylase OafA/YrhL
LKIEHNNNFDLIRLFASLQVLHFHAASVIGLPDTPAWLEFVIQKFPGVTARRLLFFISP